MKKFALFILTLFMIVNGAFLSFDNAFANNHHAMYGKQQVQQNLNANRQTKRSKQRAMQIAENRSGGKAVAVSLTGDGQSYRVRVLLANGTVKHVLVAAYE